MQYISATERKEIGMCGSGLGDLSDVEDFEDDGPSRKEWEAEKEREAALDRFHDEQMSEIHCERGGTFV